MVCQDRTFSQKRLNSSGFLFTIDKNPTEYEKHTAPLFVKTLRFLFQKSAA